MLVKHPDEIVNSVAYLHMVLCNMSVPILCGFFFCFFCFCIGHLYLMIVVVH